MTDEVSWSRVTSPRPRPRRHAGDQAARTVLDTEHGDNPYYVDQGFFNTLKPLHDVGYEGKIGVNTVLGSIPPVVVLILHQCGKYGDKIIISSHCLLLPYCEVDTSNSPKSKVRYVIFKVLFCILLKVDTFTALSAMLNADHIIEQQLCRKRDLQRRLHCLFVFCVCVFLQHLTPTFQTRECPSASW